MRWLLVMVGWPIAFHDALSGVEGELVLVASIILSVGVIWAKGIRPCVRGCREIVHGVTAMRDTIETVPGRFDQVESRLTAGDGRMAQIEGRAEVLAGELGQIRGSLEVMRDAETMMTRQALAASAARHAAIVTEDQVRVHWRD